MAKRKRQGTISRRATGGEGLEKVEKLGQPASTARYGNSVRLGQGSGQEFSRQLGPSFRGPTSPQVCTTDRSCAPPIYPRLAVSDSSLRLKPACKNGYPRRLACFGWIDSNSKSRRCPVEAFGNASVKLRMQFSWGYANFNCHAEETEPAPSATAVRIPH